MDKAQTTARSFNTRERRQLCKGLSAAIAAEAAKNKEVLEVEDNLPLRENGYHPHHGCLLYTSDAADER